MTSSSRIRSASPLRQVASEQMSASHCLCSFSPSPDAHSSLTFPLSLFRYRRDGAPSSATGPSPLRPALSSRPPSPTRSRSCSSWVDHACAARTPLFTTSSPRPRPRQDQRAVAHVPCPRPPPRLSPCKPRRHLILPPLAAAASQTTRYQLRLTPWTPLFGAPLNGRHRSRSAILWIQLPRPIPYILLLSPRPAPPACAQAITAAVLHHDLLLFLFLFFRTSSSSSSHGALTAPPSQPPCIAPRPSCLSKPHQIRPKPPHQWAWPMVRSTPSPAPICSTCRRSSR